MGQKSDLVYKGTPMQKQVWIYTATVKGIKIGRIYHEKYGEYRISGFHVDSYIKENTTEPQAKAELEEAFRMLLTRLLC